MRDGIWVWMAAGRDAGGVAAEGDGNVAGLGVTLTGTETAGVTSGDCFPSVPVVCCVVLIDSEFRLLDAAIGFPLELSR